jgi:hypothetical protein
MSLNTQRRATARSRSARAALSGIVLDELSPCGRGSYHHAAIILVLVTFDVENNHKAEGNWASCCMRRYDLVAFEGFTLSPCSSTTSLQINLVGRDRFLILFNTNARHIGNVKQSVSALQPIALTKLLALFRGRRDGPLLDYALARRPTTPTGLQ